MVKPILKQESVQIPESVTVEVKSKVVTVSGEKGTIKKSFRKMPIQIIALKDESGRVTEIVIRIWFGGKKPTSAIKTIQKHIQNMIDGVTKGFKTVMKYGYKFFAMKCLVDDEGKNLTIEKFQGDLNVRKIKAVEGVTIKAVTEDNKKELEVTGIDPNAVGLTCALINQSCKIRRVDRRIFMDGIYIFERKFQDA